MKRYSTILIIIIISLLFCMGCSINEKRDEALVGKYIAISGKAFGLNLSRDEITGFTIELGADGQAIMVADDIRVEGKWFNDDTTVTVKIDKINMVGTISEDTVTFEGFLKDQVGASIELQFAREGTDIVYP